jgi:hypothetical protein
MLVVKFTLSLMTCELGIPLKEGKKKNKKTWLSQLEKGE